MTPPNPQTPSGPSEQNTPESRPSSKATAVERVKDSDPPANKVDFLWKIHGYTNDYIKFADAKAGFAASTTALLMGAAVSSHPFDSLAQFPNWPLHSWCAAAALAILLMSFLFALIAIRPRLRSSSKRGLIFWNSVIAHGSDLKYAEECSRLTNSQMELNISRHIFALAEICNRKYFWTNLAILTGALGGILGGGVILALKGWQ